MATYPRVPTANNKQYTLDSQIAASATSLTLNESVAGVVRAPGYIVIDRIDSSGNVTANKREYKYFTGVSGAQLTGLSNADGSDQIHAVGAIVEFVPTVNHENDKYDVFVTEHSTLGSHVSLASVNWIRVGNLQGISQASLNTVNANVLGLSSLATIPSIHSHNLVTASLASINQLHVRTHFGASGASVTGVFPSGASGGVLTSQGSNPPVFAASSQTFTAYKVVPTASQTTTSTSYVDMTSGTQSVTLNGTSHVYAVARGNIGNSTSGAYTNIKVTYDSGGADTDVGAEGYAFQQEDHSVSAGGLVVSLGAGTYTFAVMKKVSAGTGTYYNVVLDIFILPA